MSAIGLGFFRPKFEGITKALKHEKESIALLAGGYDVCPGGYREDFHITG